MTDVMVLFGKQLLKRYKTITFLFGDPHILGGRLLKIILGENPLGQNR